jgi:DNA-binding transcriptional regulator YhcF (GntR family)
MTKRSAEPEKPKALHLGVAAGAAPRREALSPMAMASAAPGAGAAPQNGPEPERARPQFLINKQSAVPLHIQLKEQVRYAIMSGHFEAGNPLPSIRELTAQLGIHRNTVHRVYLELQASGLLVSKPGKGVFVSETLSDAISLKEVDEIESLIDLFFQKANRLGINPVTLAGLIAQRAPSYDSRQPTVGFVECTAHQSSEIARDLSQHFGVSVQQVLLDDLRVPKAKLAPNLRHVVTSLFHFDELRELVAGKDVRVHPVTYDLHSATRKTLREIPPGRKLAFICHDANTEEVVGAEIKERVAPGVLAGAANLEAPQLALKLIAKVDTVAFTEAAQEFCIKHCTPEHDLIEIHFALNPASVDKVGKVIRFQP